MSKKMQKPLAVALATTLAAGSVSTPAFAADAIDEGIQPPAAVETPLPADDESLQLDGEGEDDVIMSVTSADDVDDPNPEPDDDFGVSGDEDPFPDKDPGNDPDKDPDSDPDGNPEGGADSDGEAGNDPSSGNVTQFNDDSSASVDVYSESKASETPDTSDSVASVVASGILASISASALALFTRRRKSE